MDTRAFLVVFASALLFSGCTLPFLGGGEPNLVPNKANFMISIKVAELLNDPDVLSMLNKTRAQLEQEVLSAESGAGSDALNVNRLTVFGDVSRPNSSPYVGVIAFGGIDQNAYIAKAKANASRFVGEESYNGFTIYKERVSSCTSSISSDSVCKDSDEAFAFIDTAFVRGTLEAVKDMIDVKRGALPSLDNPDINAASAEVSKNAKIYGASLFPESLSSSSGTGLISSAATRDLKAAAFSLEKSGSSVDVKVALLANDSANANKALNTVNGLLSLGKAFAQPNSGMEKVLGQVQVSSKDKIVSLTLYTTVADLTALSKELGSYGAGDSGIPLGG